MKFEIGKLYKITFLDHTLGYGKEVTCLVAGWVIENTKTSVTVTHWIIDTKDKEFKDNNLEKTTIVKSTILKKRLIT